MNFIELVKKRKSVRKYLDKKIPRELIDQCIEAARLAPSACNSQPWSFLVIDNHEMINEIARKSMTGLYSLNKFIADAPVVIVVVREKSKFIARLAGTFRGIQYSLIDIGIACDHLILQATDLGLGTCWLGWFDEKAIQKILKLPKSSKIDVVLTLGFPEDDSLKEKKRNSLSEVRTYIS